MKKLYLLTLMCAGMAFAQTPVKSRSLEEYEKKGTVLDLYGNSYELESINKSPVPKPGAKVAPPGPILCSSGYFDLYFETGSGMENSTPTQTARRNVLCQVFQDISNFIDAPQLVVNGTRINIWVRNIANIQGVPQSVAGLASPYFNVPINSNISTGDIADNEIWKTINSGRDSFTNVSTPITSASMGTGNAGQYFHGLVAFRFDNISWHTNLAVAAPQNTVDLYTAMLHEVVHSLGFHTLINENGTSRLGDNFRYFSRYDTFLKYGNTALIPSSGTASLTSSLMYNRGFNPSLNLNILYPNCSIPGHINWGTPTDHTNCPTAVTYSGTSTVPVYTPDCFESGSTLSHFEDECLTPSSNNGVFTMCNKQNLGVTRRFLTEEERNTLCDIGYAMKNTYGQPGALNYHQYNSTSCSGITVAGVNDGLDANGNFTFNIAGNAVIDLIGIRNNDTNAASVEGVQDLFDPSTQITMFAGNPRFTSPNAGVHLLRYIPVSSSGRHGNITYIFVNVLGLSCAQPNACDLVLNGDFETYSQLPTFFSQGSRACGWDAGNSQTPDYFHADAVNWQYQVPCNYNGTQADAIPGHKAYIGGGVFEDHPQPGTAVIGSEPIRTRLKLPLQPNTPYQLSFDVSLSESRSLAAYEMQAYFSPTIINGIYNGEIPIANPNMFFRAGHASTKTDGWETIVFDIPASAGGEQFLYIGALSDLHKTVLTSAGTSTNCPYVLFPDSGRAYYYFDNVKLVAVGDTPSLHAVPDIVCPNQVVNLNTYISYSMPNGNFSGSGVSAGGIFDPTVAGPGLHTITYSFLNASGCQTQIFKNINVTAACPCSCISIAQCQMMPMLDNNWKFSLQHTASAFPNCASQNRRYTWYFDDGFTVVSFSPVVYRSNATTSASQSYTVMAELLNNAGQVLCDDFCGYIAGPIGPVEGRNAIVSDKRKEGLTVYPNPSDGKLSIQKTGFSGKIRINIIDSAGKVVMERQDIDFADEMTFDLTNLQGGVYIIRITSNEFDYAQKFIRK